MTCTSNSGGTIPGVDSPEYRRYIAEADKRLRAFLAAKNTHQDMLERIGPLPEPHPMPR